MIAWQKIPKQAHSISEFRRPGNWNFGDRRQVFSRNRHTPFRSFADREMEFRIPGVGSVETLHHRSLEIVKCKTPKSRETTTFQSFRYRELEESSVETLHHRSPEVAKCETPKSRETTTFRSFGYRELEESSVETLHHRSPELAICEIMK
jgi:hypothetical protein